MLKCKVIFLYNLFGSVDMVKKRKKRRRPGRKHYRINLATTISFVILVYLIIRTIMSLSQPAISTYEVTAQKIYETISTTGLAVREEKVLSTTSSGYITYYVADGERVAVNSTIYAMDQTGAISDRINEEAGISQLSDEDYVDLKNQIADYKSTYSDSNFGSIYNFKYALDNSIMEITNDSVISQVDEWISEGTGNYTLNHIQASESGVVSYCYDGLENTTIDNISPALFKNTENNMKQIRSSELYDKNTPAYRLVTDENWNLVVSLSDEQYQKMKDKEYLKVKFLKDDLTVTRGVTFIEKNNVHFAVISFNKYMERYMDERYLDIEIILQSIEGLKLPKSSLVTSELYEVPKEFVIENTTAQTGICFYSLSYDKKGTRKVTTISPNICYKDEETGNYYISEIDIDAGDVFVKNATKEEIESGNESPENTYTIAATKKVEGVYTINKVDAQFGVILNLYQADDFCIAENDTEYGIQQYDHVVLDSKALKEGQVIY